MPRHGALAARGGSKDRDERGRFRAQRTGEAAGLERVGDVALGTLAPGDRARAACPRSPGWQERQPREPLDRARDALLERRRRLPAQQVTGLADVRDVVSDLTEQGRRLRDLRRHVELRRDQLGGSHEGVPLAVGEIDRLVRDAPVRETLDAAHDSVDAVVDVGEVEHLVVSAVDRDRLAERQLVHEERQHPLHAGEVAVVAPVDVREAEDEVAEPVALRVGVDERLRGDLRRRVGTLGEREVCARLVVLLEAVDVAVDLAGRGEDERQRERAAVLEHVEGHHRVLERPLGLANELVHLGVRGEVDDELDAFVLDAVHAAAKGRVMPGKILQKSVELLRPAVRALVDAEDLVPVGQEAQRQVSSRPGPTSR